MKWLDRMIITMHKERKTDRPGDRKTARKKQEKNLQLEIIIIDNQKWKKTGEGITKTEEEST